MHHFTNAPFTKHVEAAAREAVGKKKYETCRLDPKYRGKQIPSGDVTLFRAVLQMLSAECHWEMCRCVQRPLAA